MEGNLKSAARWLEALDDDLRRHMYLFIRRPGL
jgi:hypothetical protein